MHENGRIYKFVSDAVQAAVTGAQKPQEALAAAQQQADRVLESLQIKTKRAGRRLPPSGTDPMTDQAAKSAVARAPRSHAWWNAVNAWLLLLPAAVLLVAFTHYPIAGDHPAAAFSSPGETAREVFVGLDNYRAMFEDAIFWKALVNNFWFALGTVPTSIALALADGALGQSQHARPGLPAARLFHADRAADDRGGEYLAVLLHAGLWTARSVARRWSVCRAGTGSAIPAP